MSFLSSEKKETILMIMNNSIPEEIKEKNN